MTAIYNIYGLDISSPWPLYGRQSGASGPVDIILSERRRLPVPRESEQVGPEWYQCRPLPGGGIHLKWEGLFEFAISPDGARIAGRKLGIGAAGALRTYLLGPVLSFALVRKGFEPLHSSAVVVDGRALAFIADCGQGKSTLAASFTQAGYPLLTDDLLVLRPEGRGYVASPGPPRIKLFPPMAASLLGPQSRGTRMNPITQKRVFSLHRGRAANRPAPLGAIAVLKQPTAGRAPGVSLSRLSPQQSFLELTRHTFNIKVCDAERLRRQFEFAVAVASSVPVYEVSFPREAAALPLAREALCGLLRRAPSPELAL